MISKIPLWWPVLYTKELKNVLNAFSFQGFSPPFHFVSVEEKHWTRLKFLVPYPFWNLQSEISLFTFKLSQNLLLKELYLGL